MLLARVLPLIILSLMASMGWAVDLNGRVTNAEGTPIRDALVRIYTAAPRVGTAIYCSSCYKDCQKSTTTSEDGGFTIEALDPTLVFRMLVAAGEHRAKLTNAVDPINDAFVEVSLVGLPDELRPGYFLRGRVVDDTGKPVAGATVSPTGCQTGGEHSWGRLEGVDLVSITNEQGEFLITATHPVEAFELDVHSGTHVRKKFSLVSTANESHELAVESGVIVRGRLLKEGKPVGGVSVGIVQVDRSSDTFVGDYEIASNSAGEFEFYYLPPNDDLYLYTKMESMNGKGSLPLTRVTTGGSETISEVGDVELGPACTISGRLVLPNKAKLPGPTQVVLGRAGAWDSQTVNAEGDGAFHFDDVPENEPVTISARVPGFRLSYERTRFQQTRDNTIGVFIEGPREDIDLHYEPVKSL